MAAIASSTRVMTQQPVESPELVLELRLLDEILISEMRASGLFSIPELTDWSEKYAQADDARKPLMLCYLLREQIRPACSRAASDEQQDLIIGFDEKVTNMLARLLHNPSAVEPFIAAFEKHAREFPPFQQQRDRADALMHEHLQGAAVRANGAVQAGFVAHNERLVRTLRNDQRAAEGLADAVDRVSLKVNEAQRDVLQSAQRAESLVNRMGSERARLRQVVNSAKAALHG